MSADGWLGRQRGVLHFGGRDDGHAVAGQSGTPAQINRLCHVRGARVKAIEVGEQLGFHQHAGQRYRKDVRAVIVLALVQFARFDQRHNLATVRHGQAHIDQVPVSQLFGAGDRHRW